MKLILAALEAPLAEAWTRCCGDLDFVSVHQGSILDVVCDAVISPANSFGFMDGGIDATYLGRFGRILQVRLQDQIREFHHEELLVGQADVVDTGDKAIPYLIAAPTMRVPMKLSETVNPYLAARAAFLLVTKGRFLSGTRTDEQVANCIETVAMPGLGTGVGNVGENTCAHQVRRAIDDVILELYRHPQTWAEVSERHQLLYTTMPRRLQR